QRGIDIRRAFSCREEVCKNVATLGFVLSTGLIGLRLLQRRDLHCRRAAPRTQRAERLYYIYFIAGCLPPPQPLVLHPKLATSCIASRLIIQNRTTHKGSHFFA